jgi:hypothetical protein
MRAPNGEGPPASASGGPISQQSAGVTLTDLGSLSQQVSWWSVVEQAAPLLASVGSWPMIGSPAWCLLADDDPVKLAAIYDAAQHWALRVETCQAARADASHEISGAADWRAIATEWFRISSAIAYGAYYIPRAAS